MRHRSLAALSALALALVLAGCGPRTETAPAPRDGADTNAPAAAGAPAPPFDVERVVERIRHSFRREGSAIVGGRATYSVSAADGRVSIRPVTHESRSTARPSDRRTRRRARPVVGAALELETVAAGRRGAPLELGTTPEVGAAGELELAGPGVVERVASRDDGVELSFGFPARPRGTGDLELRVRASGLEAAGETARGLHFRDPATGLGLRVGAATWIDAQGERVPVAARWDGAEIALLVPAAVVERSSFPATLDPVIGPEQAVDTPVVGPASGDQLAPAVACDGTGYLAVWADERSELFRQVFATRISAAGAVLDPAGIAVSPVGQFGHEPAVTWDGTSFLVVYQGDYGLVYGRRVATSGALVDPAPFAIATTSAYDARPVAASAGATTLVVWEDGRGVDTDVYGARVSGSTVLDPAGIAISTATGEQDFASVAFDGTHWLVVWQDPRSGSSYDVFGARVGTDGAALDSASTGIAISTRPGNESRPRVASDGAGYFVAWQDDRNAATSNTDIYGARVTDAGAVTDTAGLRLSAGPSDDSSAAVAFDGGNYLVLWVGDTAGIHGNRVSPATGAVLNGTAGILLSGGTGGGMDGIAVSPGPATYVAWSQLGSNDGTRTNAYGSRLSAALGLQDAPGVLLASSANGETLTKIAAGPRGQWLAVWNDDRADTDAIYGARIDAGGNSLDPSGILLSPGGLFESWPAVAWNGANYLVVWLDGRGGMYGTRVSPAGTVVDPSGRPLFPYGDTEPLYPQVTSNGVDWLVAWSDSRASAPGVYAGRVTAAGVSLDPSGILLADGSSADGPQVAYGAGTYLVIWTQYRSGTGVNDLWAARLNGAGTVLDATPIEVANGAGTGLSAGEYGVVYLSPSFMIVYAQDGIIARARVTSATGAVVDTGVALTGCCAYAPTIALDGSTALVVYEEQSGARDYVLRATRLTSDGIDLDATDFSVGGSGVTPEAPALAGGSEGAMLAFSRYDPAGGVTSQRVRVQKVSSVPVFPLLQP